MPTRADYELPSGATGFVYVAVEGTDKAHIAPAGPGGIFNETVCGHDARVLHGLGDAVDDACRTCEHKIAAGDAVAEGEQRIAAAAAERGTSDAQASGRTRTRQPEQQREPAPEA